jgi:hypothetical protein
VCGVQVKVAVTRHTVDEDQEVGRILPLVIVTYCERRRKLMS